MKLISLTLPTDHDLVLFGDTHYGTILRHEDGIKQAIDYIGSRPDCRAVHLGDAVEGIVFDDRRYDADTVDDPIPLRQAKKYIQDFTPIRKQLICQLLGNHEARLGKFGNLAKFMADELGTTYGTYSAVISVYDEFGLQYRLYVAHGFGAVDSKLPDPAERNHAMLRTLKRHLFLKTGDCRVMAMGHSHKLLVRNPTTELYLAVGADRLSQHYTNPYQFDTGYIPPDMRWYVNTGSFYRLYADNQESGYAERWGLNPNVLGFSVLRVRGRVIEEVELVTV